MTALDSLPILNMTTRLAGIPPHVSAVNLLPRTVSRYITFHYSGVAYADRSRAAELERVVAETAYQMHHNYGSADAPAYPDGALYDFTVLSDGTIVRLRATPVQLWHVGNATGNAESWAVHVMLGTGQAMTVAQVEGLTRLIDALRADSGIPRQNVVAHCEWPRYRGEPVRTAVYTPRTDGQSACPGATLFPFVGDYRAQIDKPAVDPNWRRYTVGPNGAIVRQAKTRDSHEVARLQPDMPVWAQAIVFGTAYDGSDEWVHVADSTGFIHSSAVRRAL